MHDIAYDTPDYTVRSSITMATFDKLAAALAGRAHCERFLALNGIPSTNWLILEDVPRNGEGLREAVS